MILIWHEKSKGYKATRTEEDDMESAEMLSEIPLTLNEGSSRDRNASSSDVKDKEDISHMLLLFHYCYCKMCTCSKLHPKVQNLPVLKNTVQVAVVAVAHMRVSYLINTIKFPGKVDPWGLDGSLPYGVSQKPQCTNKPVNHIINTKEGKDKPCEHLDSVVCNTISKLSLSVPCMIWGIPNAVVDQLVVTFIGFSLYYNMVVLVCVLKGMFLTIHCPAVAVLQYKIFHCSLEGFLFGQKRNAGLLILWMLQCGRSREES
ncbi:hypothetical protein VNO77_35434 [Canavalia gladiata]|uniref:Uncharacterized protein n=1 Tax=Canavalia gladiata TaxID=3824 RepID=A0AAN9PXR2_CANGL